MNINLNQISWLRARPQHFDPLLSLVVAFYSESLIGDLEDPYPVMLPLLESDTHGGIWLARSGELMLGYVALCGGYSLEFGGRDAFVDDFFVIPEARAQGLGAWMLARLAAEARAMGYKALHLEVDRENLRAQQLYARQGFNARDQYFLMSQDLNDPDLPDLQR